MLHQKQSLASVAISVLVLQVMAVLLHSCIREGYDEDCEKQMVRLQVLPQWDAQAMLPEGVRVMFYSLDTHRYVQDNFPARGGEIELRQGNYQMVMYNNDSEKILFRNLNDYSAIEAYTNKMSRPSFVNPTIGEETYGQPDVLWMDKMESFRVASSSATVYFKPQQQVKLYTGWVEADGLGYVHGVRGAITGMLGNINLSTGKAGRPSTIFFDALVKGHTVTFSFRSFGVFQQELPSTKNYLSLEFLLPNGVVQRNVDITDKMGKLFNGGFVQLTDTLNIPPDTTTTGGGFNGTVDDWNEIIYPIPI